MYTTLSLLMHFVMGSSIGALAFATTLNTHDPLARRFYQSALGAAVLFLLSILSASLLPAVEVDTHLLADSTMSGIGCTLLVGLAMNVSRRIRRRSFR